MRGLLEAVSSSAVDALSRLVKSLARAAADLEAAREKRDRLIVQATEEGMSRREIARATGLSFQRVQQIVEEQRGR